ncbi:TIGR02281 family clan AA aspartic protease [Pseudomonas sp. ZM23]|uniref:TIGR02281 family clan AA aspartic protease n=1 Tax=Pseudomonas triclosanedens TaxID=2961893 RepID=A0ABY6ZYN0_9PSED|nr:TIGR02281 family clan AA aspartic protease [Pseudomonas triclosanedens]MCP8465133.1 TIGR02281 family clan AA aspartic protease [Pseudomonas triclosanedens]MCP8470927.1 TIGR02281 family clan AA aspartic protease [Pseudomonas triclosanedens]MCP8476433.1 TIGR02281 family clan AA aspartic protease [Pseudomonas triclosanedens]WAI49110.1 TIGR02281 family clan AA aspartic protease [Pseudomonas triclosanedens]
MSDATPGRRLGKVMMFLAWGAGILLATHYFGAWEKRQNNPNQQPESVHGAGYVEVRLLGNRAGHYVVDGRINGQPVTFMLDTGATQVAIPQELARNLGLARGAPVTLNTANGRSEGWRTRLSQLDLGDIRLNDVSALVAPGMEGDEVLLGMSALKQLDFTQQGGTLVLRQNSSP